MDQVVAVLLTVFLTQCIRGTQGHSRGRELASFLVFETDSNITVEGPTSGLNVNIDTGNISTGVAHWVGNTDFQKVKLVASNRVSIPDYVVTLVDSGLNPISPGMSNSAGIAVHTFLSFVRGLRNEYIPSQFLTVNGSSVVGLDFKQTEAQLPVLLGEGGTMLTTTSSGRVTFSGLYLQNPVQGQYQLNITFQPPLSGAVAGRVFSNATLYFEVLPGSPHGGLQLLRSPATVSSNALLDSSPPLPLTLQPVLALLDSSGNLAHSAQDSSIVTARVDNTAGPLVVELSSAERLGGEVVTTVNGLALFSRLGFRGRPGAQYTISFLRANDAAAASSATTAKVAVRPCADQRAVGDERGNCDCPAGFVKEDDTVFHGDLLRCDECPSGQYRAAADLSCRTCPLNMRTFVAAAPSAQQCECEEGYYLDLYPGESAGDTSCKLCPSSVFCPARSKGVASWVLRRGFWRSSNRSDNIYECRIDGDNAYANCLGTSLSLCAPVVAMDVVRSSGMLSARNASQLAGVEGETAQFRYESGITAYRDRNGNTIASSYPLQIIWDSNTDSTVLLPLLLLSGFEVRFVNGSSRGSDGSNTVGASSANFTSTKAAASEAAKRYNSYSLKNSGALVVPSLNPTELHGAAYAGYYYGVRCELCSPGTGRNLEVCEACPPAETNTYILILYGFLGFCVVSGMVGTTMLAGHSRVHHEHKLQEKVVRHSDVEFRLRQMLTGCDSGAVPNHKLETTATAKIAVNYMQLTSLAKQIPMRWPGPIQNMLDLQEKFSSPNLQVASVECALRASAAASGGGSTFFSKFRLIMLLPPAAIVGSAIVWYSWYLFSRTSVHEACVGQYYRSRIGSMRRRLLKMRLESTPEKVEAAEEKLARFRMRAAPKTAKQKWETATARFIVTVLVLLFFCHSTLTKYLFAVFTCEEIDEVEYLKIDLEVVCGQGEHAVISSVAFVLLFVYSFGIPMVGYLVLRKNIKDITFRATAECPLHHARSRVLNQFKDALGHRGLYFKDHSLNWLLWGEEITPCTCRDRERRALSDRLIARLGFLFNGFKKQGMCPYWEVLPVMLRKVCFLLIVVRCQDYPIIIQALMALLLVFVALVVHVAHCPYELSALNSLELTSLLTSFFTLAAGVFFLIPETPPHWLTAIIVFVLVINAVTCVRLVFKLISSLVMFLPKHWRQNLFRFMPCMRAHNAFVRRQHRKIDGKGNKLSTVAPLSRGFGVTAVKGWSKLRCHNAEGDLVKMLKRSSGNGEVHVLDTLKEVAEAMIAPIGRTQPLASQLRDSCVDMRTALTNANLWHKHAPLSLDVTALDSAAECVVHAAFASARAIPPPIHLKACSRALSLLEVRFNCGPRPPTLSDSQSSTLSTSQSKTTIEVRALAELRSPSHPLAVPGADGSGAAVPGVRAPDAVPLKPAGHRMSTFECAIASAAAETWIRHMEAVKMEEGWAHPEPEIWLMDLVARAGEVLQVLRQQLCSQSPPDPHRVLQQRIKACSRASSLLKVRLNCGPRPSTLRDSQSSTQSSSQSQMRIESMRPSHSQALRDLPSSVLVGRRGILRGHVG